jgi:hypothetical protein
VDGEFEDMASTMFTKTPRSYGDFRRRLWKSLRSSKPSPVIEYEDGERFQVPSAIQRKVLDGSLKNWQEFYDKL